MDWPTPTLSLFIIMTSSANRATTATSSKPRRLNRWLRIDVPSMQPTLADALQFCKQQLPSLGENGFIQIKIADGEYYLDQVEIDFFSDKVEIMGNVEDPDKVKLHFNTTYNRCGFLIQRGNGIFKIDGMTINGVGGFQGYGVWADESYGAGIMCTYNSQVLVGASVRINRFYYGVAARYGASVRCEPGVIVQFAGDAGFFAYAASVDAQHCQAYHCAHLSDNLGFGFCAEAGGFINADNSNSAHHHKAGFYALTNGSMWCHDSSANENQHGYLALHGGVLTCNSMNGRTNAYRNFGYGYFADNGGRILANRCLGNENTQGGFFARHHASIDITMATANHNGGNGYVAINATLTGNAAEAKFNQDNGFLIGQGGFLDGEGLMAYGNQGYGYHLNNAQAFMPNARGWKNVQGRMLKSHSWVAIR